MSEQTKITTVGIKKTLASVRREHAIAEYIWNGFDAGATIVEVTAKPISEGFESLEFISVRDNGEGIARKQLKQKFTPFLESTKAARRATIQTSEVQGQEGKGRLTFFRFADSARWETVFVERGERFAYTIKIDAGSLDQYDPTECVKTRAANGTIVTFLGIHADFTLRDIETSVINHLKVEFGWYLKLNEANGKRLLINGEPLDYASTIADAVSVPLTHPESNTKFLVDFIQWKGRQDEYSKVYFLDSSHNEKFKRNSRFNNKGDSFFHSVFVTSSLFEHLVIEPDAEDEEDTETSDTLEFETSQRKAFRFLRQKVEEIIRERRRIFLRRSSAAFLQSLYQENVVPAFRDTPYDRLRRQDFENVVKTVYETEPKFFTELSSPQKKTFLGFLNLLLDSDERGRILDILDEVLKLTEAEKSDLCAILKTSRLNNIVAMLKLLTDRLRAVELIKELAFNFELKANEVKDLQSAIEAHYWLFGEQYHLVTAAEPNFEEALRRHTYLLHGDAEPVKIDHPDRRRQMDIFAVRQLVGASVIENIVVELKHPEIKLGEKELSQVKKYLDVISTEPRFNASNSQWRFYLVGNSYDRFIEREVETNKQHSEPGLVQKFQNFRIYVRTWAEVFNDFKIRYNTLTEKLVTERQNLTDVPSTKIEIGAELQASTAKITAAIVPAKV